MGDATVWYRIRPGDAVDCELCRRVLGVFRSYGQPSIEVRYLTDIAKAWGVRVWALAKAPISLLGGCSSTWRGSA